MKFSVVLSNYNGSAYLSEAIKSVLDQDYDNYEFIIVDDGSTDTSPEIINDYAEQHPTVIVPLIEKDNEGQAAGFNKGVAASSGDIIALLDSDDLWMPSKLSNLCAFIRITGFAALYQHNLFFIRNDKKTEEPYRPLLYTGDLYTETCQTRRLPAFVPTSGLAFPREVLDKVLPIPISFRTCADGYLTRTTFCHGRVASCCESWAYYRVHEANCVFDNPEYDSRGYRNNLLIPSLNRYYEIIGSELRYPALVKLQEVVSKSPEAKSAHQPDTKISEQERLSQNIELVPITGSCKKEFLKALIWRLLNVSIYDVYAMLMKRLGKKKKGDKLL